MALFYVLNAITTKFPLGQRSFDQLTKDKQFFTHAQCAGLLGQSMHNRAHNIQSPNQGKSILA